MSLDSFYFGSYSSSRRDFTRWGAGVLISSILSGCGHTHVGGEIVEMGVISSKKELEIYLELLKLSFLGTNPRSIKNVEIHGPFPDGSFEFLHPRLRFLTSDTLKIDKGGQILFKTIHIKISNPDGVTRIAIDMFGIKDGDTLYVKQKGNTIFITRSPDEDGTMLEEV